jgi:hypothetical protein
LAAVALWNMTPTNTPSSSPGDVPAGSSDTCVRQHAGHPASARAVAGLIALAASALVACKSSSKADGLAAWNDVYSVLVSPRCLNCHTATSFPQQGDDRHRHFANVTRGPEGRGVPGLTCAGCHQVANADSTGVPGAPDWHLAPLSMQWQDAEGRALSSADVCRSVTDRSRNNGLDGHGLLKHHERDALVLWAWSPGMRADGTARTLPPLTHDAFIRATRRWVEAGTPCP